MMLRMLLMTFTVASAIQMDLSPAHRVGRNATTLSAFSQLSESIDFGAGGDIIKTIINQFNEMIIEINKEKIEEGKKGLGQCTDNVAAVVTIAPADGSVTGCAASSKCQTDQTGYQTEATTQGNTITGLNAEIATLAGSITDSKKSIADAEAALAKVKSDQLVTDQDNLNDINKHNAQLAVLKKVQAALHENGTISMPESLLSVEEKKIIGNSRVTRPILLMVQVLQTAKPADVIAIKQLLAEMISRIEGIIDDKNTKNNNDKTAHNVKVAADEKAIADKKIAKNAAVIKKAGKETDLVAPTKAKADADNNIRTAAQLCKTGFDTFKNLQTGYDDEDAAIKEIIQMLGGLTFNTDTKAKIDSIETCLDNGGCAETCTMAGNDAVCSCKSPKVLENDKKSCAEYGDMIGRVWGPQAMKMVEWNNKVLPAELCITAGATVGMNLVPATCDGSDLQIWSVLKNGKIINKGHPGKCLTHNENGNWVGLTLNCTAEPGAGQQDKWEAIQHAETIANEGYTFNVFSMAGSSQTYGCKYGNAINGMEYGNGDKYMTVTNCPGEYGNCFIRNYT